MFNTGTGTYSLSDIAAVSGRQCDDGMWGGNGSW